MKPSDASKSVKILKKPIHGAKFKLTIPDFKALNSLASLQSMPRKSGITPESRNLKQEQGKEHTSQLLNTSSQRVLPKNSVKLDPVPQSPEKLSRPLTTVKFDSVPQSPEKLLRPVTTLKSDTPDLKKTYLYTYRESPQYQNPNLKSTREISKFDCWEEGKTPEEWVLFYKKKPIPHGQSPIFESGIYKWEDVEVLGYEKKKFIVRVIKTSAIKKVQRLAIRFNQENEKEFELRVSQAREFQEYYDSELRFIQCIDEISLEKVSQLRKETKTNIINKTLATKKHNQSNSQVEFLKNLMTIVEDEYIRSMKKWIVLLRMKDPANDHEFISKRIIIRRPKFIAPYYGTLRLPPYSYVKAKKKIEEIHWYRIPEVVQVNKITAAKCYSFLDHRFLETNSLPRPIELKAFYNFQKNHFAAIKQQISIHWREYLISETQDKMAEKYNFFAVNSGEYQESDLHNVLRRLDFIVNTYVRVFSDQSLDELVDFLQSFCNNNKDSKQSDKPLIILHLSMESSSKSKKDKKKTISEGKIDFKPTIAKTQNLILECIDWIIDGTNKITNLECDLVPFMNIDKTPSFELLQNNPKVLWAKSQITSLLDSFSVDPLSLLARYKKFEWIGKIQIKEYIKNLFEVQPSIETLRTELIKLKNAKDELVILSNNIVNFDLFQIECTEVKKEINLRLEKCMQALLEKIANFCEKEILEIHNDYSFMCEKISSVPANEDELFELKQFGKNMKTRGLELSKKEKEVLKHTAILEDYQFIINEEISRKLWDCKTWPSFMESSLKEGLYKLSTEEEKFREKLEKEKDIWYRDTIHLQESFEIIQQYSDYFNYSTNYNEVKKLEAELKQAMDKMISFNNRETLFELVLSDKSDLQKMIDEFEPYNKLWTNVSGFEYEYDYCMNDKPMMELNANLVASSVEKWIRDCYALNKKLVDKSPEAINVINHLKDRLADFQENIPLIKAICNEAWNDDHWSRMAEMAGLEKGSLDSKKERLSSLVNKGMKDYIQKIEEISYKAQREFKLKKKLEEMKKEYEGLQLEVMNHKDTYILKTIEDIQVVLDEQLVSVQSMKTSPYAKPIENSCKEWETRLSDAQDTLEQWVLFQSVWMSLEPIFSSDDIQKRLAAEFHLFRKVDLPWKILMESTYKDPSLIDAIPTDKSTLNQLRESNKHLDEIQKSMHDYLNGKRTSFPRFFFLSDEDLLDILSKTKDPLNVQEHLNKCFEAIDKIVFNENLEVTHMISPEKEIVEFINKVDVNHGDNKGNVEFWMKDIERTMFKTLEEMMKKAIEDYGSSKRTEWLPRWPAMIILCVNQLFWTSEAESAIASRGLPKFEEELSVLILEVVSMVRTKVDSLLRKTLSAVITLDVHARDIIADIKTKKIPDVNQFDWIAQLRYYTEKGKVLLKMVNSSRDYGYEYLGNTPRLVITPLTDRCYRTLMGAYTLNYGGAPEGPAGTGKTESTKDLAKAVAIKCVVFNCSDTLDSTAMGKFFKGLASSGSWCCFDEFNRIEPEVLSVVAMQILQIQQAIKERKRIFTFDGTQLSLVLSCAINITMNPGYAGRSELPDNLKALFRPCAMMVPDYAMISEISLYSYGFENARPIAVKIVASLKLSSEQLSTKDHYDFGMRAVKAILTACGNLKQKFPDQPEYLLALRGLYDVNLPKFTIEDIPLFKGITSDLFPGITLPDIDYGNLITAIVLACEDLKLQPTEEFKKKCIQLYETTCVRHGLMLVGQTFSGKTQVINTLQDALTSINDSEFTKTIKVTINPKSISLTQLYGKFIAESHQSYDGVVSLAFRQFCNEKGPEKKWVVFDGPVDSKWIENMNTVLDDNKMLCMPSGEVIKLIDTMTMMFEVEDLKEASPATVSRCGMVYLEPQSLGWNVLLVSFVQSLPNIIKFEYGTLIEDIILWFLSPSLEFLRKNCKYPTLITEMEMVNMLIQTFDCFISEYRKNTGAGDESPVKLVADPQLPQDFEESVFNWILFSVIWGLGGGIDESSRPLFCEFLTSLKQGEDVKSKYNLIDIPSTWINKRFEFKLKKDYYDCFYDKRKEIGTWTPWQNLNTIPYSASPNSSFHELIVPTKDTLRIYYFLELYAINNKHVLFCGPTGTGKTASVLDKLNLSFHNESWNYLHMTFSAQTSANKIQKNMESNMEKKVRKVYAPKGNKKLIIFVDDLNMPLKEIYGAQPPIELLRQWMDHGGWYDLETKEFNSFKNIQFISCMGPPGGGRSTVTQRYMRHYHKVYIETFGSESMTTIYSTVLDWFFAKQSEPFPREIVSMKSGLVSASLYIYQKVCTELLPTPAKMHYIYNLRDISKVFQGISRSTSLSIKEPTHMIKLWVHECERVFQDRLISTQDREYFDNLIQDSLKQFFTKEFNQISLNKPLLFASFLPTTISGKKHDNIYSEIENINQLQEKMKEILEYYNQTNAVKMNLVLFVQAIEHVIKIVRILQQPLGHGLLLGVGGSGRKSLAFLSSSIVEFEVFEVEITKNFGISDWRDRLKALFYKAGIDNIHTVFLFSDTQIANEGFLEDINNILNNGEVPGMFEDKEDSQKIRDNLADEANQNKKGGSEEAVYKYFIEKVRNKLHLLLCLSPIGESFRTRLRMFPSLVNCTTIDWFLQWPEEALRSVATEYLSIDVDSDTKQGLINICVDMQSSVTALTVKYREEMRRYYYITPTSYLQLISTFKKLIETKRVQVKKSEARYRHGLEKLLSTAQKVSLMQKELEELQPKLVSAQLQTKEMMKDLTVQHKQAQKVQETCEIDEATCKEEREKASSIKEDCEERLKIAMPVYESAVAALDKLNRNDIDEVKHMVAPPAGVRYTMEAVCKLMNIPPVMVPKKSGFGKEPDYWETAKKSLLNNPKLLQDLKNYEKDNIDPNIIANIEKIINSPDFQPKKIEKSNLAAYSLSMWVRAMHNYDKVMKEIKPKQAALAEAEAKLKSAETQLAEKMENLKNIQEVVNKLESEYQTALEKEKKLQQDVDLCVLKLDRAQKLIEGLKDEKIRWADESESLKVKYANNIGDLILCSGIIAYLGVFTGVYRSGCIENWIKLVKSNSIPSSNDFSIQKILGDQVKIRDWTMSHLPSDVFSIDNAIIMEYSPKWPLIIDPQVQANGWIKSMEGTRLVILRQSSENLTNSLVNAINNGYSVLIENLGEEIVPELDGILSCSKNYSGVVKIGDKSAEMSKEFNLYLTTKLTRPHYSPETCLRVVLVNFMTTEEGLLDQMLALTVSIEFPQTEVNRQKLIVESAKCKKELKNAEDKILNLVSNAEGDILENENLIFTLQESKNTSRIIQDQLAGQESFQKTINDTRKTYRHVASRVSQLFFVVADLSMVENMYQYSLEWYQRLYTQAISESEKTTNANDRTRNIINTFTNALYQNICRSLFEKDKLLFSFLICLKILSNNEEKDYQAEVRFLMTGGSTANSSRPNPSDGWLENKDWASIIELSEFNSFNGFANDFISHVDQWKTVWESTEPENISWPGDWKGKLTLVQQVIILRILRPDKVVSGIEKIISKELGPSFVSPPPFNLELSFKDSNTKVPIVFILSPGVDPILEIEKLALKKGLKNKMTPLSLGEGQGQLAEAAIKNAIDEGGWVILQNCHLAISWMPVLEKKIDDINPEATNDDFRIWLTTMPSSSFPVSILQNSVKVTNEPPKGLKKNIIRSYMSYDQTAFEDCKKPKEFKRLVYSLSFFHAVIQERRKFGALGWNIPYEFSMSDLSISFYQLHMFLDGYESIPWDALKYMVAEANYGGRVTDVWDRRLINTILLDYYNKNVLKDNSYFNNTEVYKIPPEGPINSYIQSVDESFPHSDLNKVFGLHDNALITSAINETNFLLASCLSLLPRTTSTGDKTSEQIITELAIDIYKRLPGLFDIERTSKKYVIKYEDSMNTVLIQELIRYNRLLSVVKTSTVQLKDAIAGLITMSADLEKVFNALFDNKVPELWSKSAYPSLKPLAQWVEDLISRLEFMQNWIDKGPPSIFWISGFFFTQSFLTGVLQNFARTKKIPIDSVCFDFEVVGDKTPKLDDGCYIKGLYLDGGKWDEIGNHLTEPLPKILYYHMPTIWMKPIKTIEKPQKKTYECPVYKTSKRQGTLLTTGHSTNFVLSISIRISPVHTEDHWIKRGTALLTQLDY
jgi:dynein heavy chain, axonemal